MRRIMRMNKKLDTQNTALIKMKSSEYDFVVTKLHRFSSRTE